MGRSKTIGAVIAMEIELRHLLAQGQHIEQETAGPWQLFRFRLGSQAVVAVLSGIGMVNAAAATEFLIGREQPELIVNSGCTGAHVAELLPGDVVIGTELVYHAALQILANGEERYTGFAFDTVHGEIRSPSLPADRALVKFAEELAPSITLPAWPEALDWPASEPRREPRIVSGPVASADIWTQQITRIEQLHTRHRTLCEDMEAAAIGQIAARHGIAFLTIKDISNNERHAQTDLVGELAGFPMEEAGRRAAIVLAEIIRAHPLP